MLAQLQLPNQYSTLGRNRHLGNTRKPSGFLEQSHHHIHRRTSYVKLVNKAKSFEKKARAQRSPIVFSVFASLVDPTRNDGALEEPQVASSVSAEAVIGVLLHAKVITRYEARFEQFTTRTR